MKKLLLLLPIILILLISKSHSQLSGQAKIDSLLTELPKAKKDTNHVNLLRKLSFGYWNIDPDEGIKFGLQGVELAKELNWKLGEANCYGSLGVNYSFGKSDYSKSLEYYLKSLKLYEDIDSKDGIASTLGNIASLYSDLSDFPKALDYYKKAMKHHEKEGTNRIRLANTYNGIGNIHAKLLNYEEALDYFNRSISIYKELNAKFRIAITSLNIAGVYSNQMEYPKALVYLNEALEIQKEIGDKRGIGHSLGLMGVVYFKISQDDVIIEPSDANELISLNKTLNLNKSIELTLESINISEETGELYGRIGRLKLIADALQQKGDYKNSNKYLREHIELKDSLFSRDKQKEITKLTAERDQIESERKEEEEARILDEETSRRDNLQYSVITIITIFAFTLIFYLSKKSISYGIIDTLLFLSFLLIYEFILVFADPYVDDLSGGEPIYKLLMNFGIALIFIPFHKMEMKFKNRLKSNNKNITDT